MSDALESETKGGSASPEDDAKGIAAGGDNQRQSRTRHCQLQKADRDWSWDGLVPRLEGEPSPSSFDSTRPPVQQKNFVSSVRLCERSVDEKRARFLEHLVEFFGGHFSN